VERRVAVVPRGGRTGAGRHAHYSGHDHSARRRRPVVHRARIARRNPTRRDAHRCHGLAYGLVPTENQDHFVVARMPRSSRSRAPTRHARLAERMPAARHGSWRSPTAWAGGGGAEASSVVERRSSTSAGHRVLPPLRRR
jgi:hypothetical protein